MIADELLVLRRLFAVAMRDVEGGRIRNQQGPFGRRCDEWNHHAGDEGPCLVTTPARAATAFGAVVTLAAAVTGALAAVLP
ncbi:hypothetical protein [Streptomyces sp. NPDC056387]|uniref:hypothetical protein n=1 Tax=Streptomyces sp. NPDC056387 TaxID=3345803 RepID=UPI0035DBA19C